MLAAKQYRDQRQVNSAKAISLFQQVKDVWLSICPQDRHHICMSLTEKVRMSSPAVEVLEIPRSDYWNTCENLEDDSDYQEMIRRDTCTLEKADEESKPFRSYQEFMSPEPEPCSNSQESISE
ncbi:hypothetical protein K3495_g13436 [Podosphaera aphanis]|nr:hypothetical protein K3495_g13436 [Podosphaera aphanis]